MENNGVIEITTKDLNTIKDGYIEGVNGRIDLENGKVYTVAMDSSRSSGFIFIKNRKVYNFEDEYNEFYDNLLNILKENKEDVDTSRLGFLYYSGEFFRTEYEKEAIKRTFGTSNIEDITWWN